jgi:hypothetical protein
VRDIDIYHTDRDKALYSGGLFWHTFHYVDAGRSTHRCYPNVPGVPGGGPANEHAYSTGLMLHYFLTGEPESKDAAIKLAEWVLRIDDGSLTAFRWLSRADTGWASKTHTMSYHGPGRGAGNAIVVLLNGYRLTGRRDFLDKAEVLIRRCIHPDDDITARNLLDPESRWSYTVFLQALGRYLDEKIVLREIDAAYAYAQGALLHYARWMSEHEYPYLEKPERLEYPTETWAAQDMRKSEVFKYAAIHESGASRPTFVERSEYFFRRSLDLLLASPRPYLARPRVILLSVGFMHAALAGGRVPFDAPIAQKSGGFGPVARFTPQRDIAMRRAIALAAAGAALLVTALGVGLVAAWQV